MEMITKIISVKGIGKFDQNFRAPEPLKKINIIYGENGRGKSTISAILRSLCSGDPNHIFERKTLNSSSHQEVRILGDASNSFTFKDGKWNKAMPNLEIFDSWFIDNNVYSGTDVNIDHRRNLHHFVIGENGVEYAKKIDEFDRNIKLISDKISGMEQILKRSKDPFDVTEFVNLVEDPDLNIDQKIEDKIREIETLKKAVEISKKPSLSSLCLPIIPRTRLDDLLSTTIADISKEAEKNTLDHISRCMDDKGERWVQKGMEYIKNNKCPFCDQSVSDSTLIKAYQSYFDDRYLSLKQDVGTFSNEIEQKLSERYFSEIKNLIITNDLLVDFWKEYIDFEYTTLDSNDIGDIWDRLRSCINEYLRRKISSPLEPIELKSDLLVPLRLYNFETKAVEEYNKTIEKINVLIEAKKISVECGDLNKMQRDLEILEAKKIRFTRESCKLCDEYKCFVEEKAGLTTEKKIAKENLDTYTYDVFSSYESGINAYLEKCGADFKIEGIKTGYRGGRPSVSYFLSINGSHVDILKSEANVPSFKNTLSEGDKSTLAFVFFLSKLNQDPNLHDKVVVFDDPISSLDSNRKYFTQQQVLNLAERCKQVIVLSHDIQFSRNLFYGIQGEICTLIIRRRGSDSIIEKWDLEKETRGAYFKNYDIIREYINNGPRDVHHSREVARSIRPLLEGYYRIKFPEDFGQKEWLGDLLKKIKSAEQGKPLFGMNDKYLELNSINEYSKKYHHENPGADSEPINDRELTSFAKRTIELIYG
jgi:wobble nucleotide-excising tRNase